MKTFDLIQSIKPIDKDKVEYAKSHWNSLAKPLYGMGILEEYISRIFAINNLNTDKKAVAVFCADNGIVAENVTQTTADVTAVVAENITKGDATICHMAKISFADVFPIDVGMLSEVYNVPIRKTSKGSKNFALQPAMTREEAIKAIEVGIDMVRELKEKGYNIIASGEMGIGNTTSSSAVTSAIFSVNASEVTGKGAGLSPNAVIHKALVIDNAKKLHKPDPSDPIDILSKVGGYDIAAITGLFLGGAIYNVPIIIDGFISSVGATLAIILNENVRDYIFSSHSSNEPGAKYIAKKMGFNPPLNLQMALGEGTGAVALMPLIDMAVSVYKNMITFNQSEIKEYKPL